MQGYEDGEVVDPLLRSSANPTYLSWKTMRARCLNVNDPYYKDYGGRGIGIDASWDEFERFVRDMGMRPEGMTLDRIENSRGYSKSNCQWSNATYQGRNKRNSRYIEFNGSRKTLIEWSEVANCSYTALQYRLRVGWSIEEALSGERYTRKKKGSSAWTP